MMKKEKVQQQDSISTYEFMKKEIDLVYTSLKIKYLPSVHQNFFKKEN